MKTKNRPKREPRRVHKFKKRAGWRDNHHLKNKARGGQTIGSNLIEIDAYRHDAWHLLFKDKSLKEIINLLTRLEHLKESQRFQGIIN